MKYNKYINTTPIGIHQLFPYSLCIFTTEGDEYAVSAFNRGGGKYSDFRRTKIRYSGDRPYIERFKRRYYFDDIARVNSPWCNGETCREIV